MNASVNAISNNSNSSNNMNKTTIAQSTGINERRDCGINERRDCGINARRDCNIALRQPSLLDRIISALKDFGSDFATSVRDFSRKTVKAFNWLNRHIELGSMLVITYVVALSSVLALLACIAWFLGNFCPAFFWEHFGRPEVEEVFQFLTGVPMLYQVLGVILTLCFCFYVGRPFCAAVLAIQQCLMDKDYAGIKSVLAGVKEHINGLVHSVTGFILKCAVGTATVYLVWQAMQQM